MRLRLSWRDRRLLALIGVGVGAYLTALVATIPAAVVLDRSETVVARAGTVWNGEAALAGGDRLRWEWAPLRSLTSLGFAVDWQVTGVDSDLAGRALLRPGSLLVDKASGRAGGSLIEALAPALPFRCAVTMQIELARAAIGGDDHAVNGEVRTDAGSCRLKQASDLGTALPPLVMAARPIGEGTELTLAPAAQRRRLLATGTISPSGRLTLRVSAAGAVVLPFAVPPGSAGVTVETDL